MKLILLVLLLLSVAAWAKISPKADADVPIPSTLLEAAATGDLEGIVAALENGTHLPIGYFAHRDFTLSIQTLGDNIDTRNVNGWSSAMFTVYNGDMLGLDKLITSGIDLNGANVDGITPLMMAAAQSDKEMVELLIAGNASPLLIANDGSTAYTMAVGIKRFNRNSL